MSFQRKWLLAFPAVMVVIAIVWIVARPTGENAGQSWFPGVETPAAAPAPAEPATESRSPDPAAAVTTIPDAPAIAEAREPGLSTAPDGVELSDRAGQVITKPDDRPPLPPGFIPPDLVTLPSSNLFIGYDTEGTKYLHFENSILNQGVMPLELHGTLNPKTNVTEVIQRIYAEDGAYIDRPIGSFHYHPSHEHWHIADLAEYQLWSVDSEGLIGEPVVVARKASYCLRDDAHYPFDPHPDSWPDVPTYEHCETVIQGISPGWMDTYAANTPGQDIDITGLPDGAYALVSRANPDGVLYETDYENNIAITMIELTGDHVVIVESTPIPPPPVTDTSP